MVYFWQLLRKHDPHGSFWSRQNTPHHFQISSGFTIFITIFFILIIDCKERLPYNQAVPATSKGYKSKANTNAMTFQFMKHKSKENFSKAHQALSRKLFFNQLGQNRALKELINETNRPRTWLLGAERLAWNLLAVPQVQSLNSGFRECGMKVHGEGKKTMSNRLKPSQVFQVDLMFM